MTKSRVDFVNTPAVTVFSKYFFDLIRSHTFSLVRAHTHKRTLTASGSQVLRSPPLCERRVRAAIKKAGSDGERTRDDREGGRQELLQ